MDDGWEAEHLLSYCVAHALDVLSSGKLKIEIDDEELSLDGLSGSCVCQLARDAAKRVDESDKSGMKDPFACGGVEMFEVAKVKAAVSKALNDVICEYAQQEKLTREKGRFSVDSYAERGRRPQMEDRHIVIEDLNSLLSLEGMPQQSFFAVYDGHGGKEAADFAAAKMHMMLSQSDGFSGDNVEQCLKASFEATDSAFLAKAERDALSCGATACSVYIRENKLYVAWLGDSQTIMVRNNEAVELMTPHKPEDENEKKRIEDDGGVVVWYGAWRVNGTLSVARAIGDKKLKKWVIGTPGVNAFDLDGSEDYLVLGCDGLFDVMKPDEIIAFISAWKEMNPDKHEGVAKAICEHCVQELNCTDNVTVVVAFFNK